MPKVAKMGFGKLKIKLRCEKGRGGVDSIRVVEAMVGTWSELQDGINNLDSSEQEALKDHFNDLIENETDLG